MYEYKCEIVKIVDGDTIDVNIDLGFGTWIHNERIRLYGIDTPESRTRDLPVGSKQVLRTKKDKSGKFGRVLGDFVIYDGQEDRNMGIVEYMIKHNIGVEYTGQSKQQIQEHHLQNRQYLKAQGFID